MTTAPTTETKNRVRLRRLPARIGPPVPGEFLRTYLVRVAAANHIPVAAIYNSLGFDATPPSWVGMHLDPDLAADLEALIGLTTEEAEVLHIDQDRYPILNEYDNGHPDTVRVCPSCVAETGAWQRRWADPLNFVCHLHGLLLVERLPGDDRPIQMRRIEPTIRDTDWRAAHRTATPDHFGLVDDQRRLDDLRMSHPVDDPNTPERIAHQLIVAMRDAIRLKQNKTGPSVRSMFRSEIGRLNELGYTGLDVKAERAMYGDTSSLWLRVEHLALLAPSLIAGIQEARQTSSHWLLEEIRSDLVEISQTARRATKNIADPWKSFVIQGSAPGRSEGC